MTDKIQVMTVQFYLVLLLATTAQAGNEIEYRYWASGQFVMPREIANETSPDKLKGFLASNRAYTRMATARRLGELMAEKAIQPLLEVYQKEPAPKGLHAMPLVKLEIIRTLGRMDSNDAMIALSELLKRCWQEGPKMKDKQGYRLDRDFTPVTRALLRELQRWSDNRQVFDQAKAIALSEDVRDYYIYPDDLGDIAWQIYLKGDLGKKGLNNEKDAGLYLFKFIEDLRASEGSGGALPYVKMRAAYAILTTYSERTLTSLAKGFEEELRQIPLGPGDVYTKQHIDLRRRISFVEEVLREREKTKREPVPTQRQDNPSQGNVDKP